MSGEDAAVVVVALLAAMSVFQVALACGAPIGAFAWGGQHRVLPRRLRVGSVVGVGIYAVMAVVVLDRVGRIDVLPGTVAEVGAWVVVAYLALGIALNAASRSRPERLTMVPLTVGLTALAVLVATA